MQLARNDAYTSNYTLLALAAWLCGAVAVVASGALARAPLFALPATIGTLTVLTIAWTRASRVDRRFSLAQLAWFHAWRVVPGAAFLVLYANGGLPWGFAVPGGVGDVAVAALAPLAAWAASRDGRAARAGYVTWQVLGLLDLAGVVRAAFVISRADPASMHLLRELPLGLLPTFAVPLTFAAHAIALRRALTQKS